MEIIDLYADERISTGKTSERGENFRPQNNENMQVVHICIFNKNNEMLIQKRRMHKKQFGGYWDFSAGGCSQTGETSRQAAARELFEEIGLNYDFSNVRPHLTMNFNHGFDDYYLLKLDVDLNTLKFVDGEVEDVKWASKDELLKMIEMDQFVPFVSSFVESLFELKEIHGAIRE